MWSWYVLGRLSGPGRQEGGKHIYKITQLRSLAAAAAAAAGVLPVLQLVLSHMSAMTMQVRRGLWRCAEVAGLCVTGGV
jgi:hypothetical protein